MASEVDFKMCEKWHKCGSMHSDMEDVKDRLKDADVKRDEANSKRDSMEETLSKIEGHLAVGNEKFKWIERAGWALGSILIFLVGYMIIMSISGFNRDAEQNIQLKGISKDVEHIGKVLGVEK